MRIHPRLVVQLNLFFGHLYIDDCDFKDVSEYLGLAAETAKDDWEIAADEFILKDGQDKVGGAVSSVPDVLEFRIGARRSIHM